MRKLIPIIFIFVCCSNASLAQITCTQSATTNCESGCYYTETSGCKICDDGKYTANTGSTSCSDCSKPSVATFTSAGTSADGCTWQITCTEGTQFISTGDSNSACKTPTSENFFFPNARTITGTGFGTTEGGKYECYTNSYRNKDYTGCICNRGYHLFQMENDDTDTTAEHVVLDYILDDQDRVICYANDYTITYKSSNDQNAEKETHTVEFNSTVTLKTDKPFTKTGYTLSGWKLEGTNKTYTDKQIITYEFDHDITLLAQWSGKSFKITYQVGDAGATCQPANPTSCTYGNICSAPNIPSDCTYNGYLFKGWKCTSDCNDSDDIISPGTDINNISGGVDITLTAQWAECPAGHYCPDIKTDNTCPAGSTSDAKSTAITQCYMVGGTTIILDAAENEFTLPGTTKTYYHGGKK